MGERSSGTNFTTLLLSMNTPLTHTDLLGWKHGTPHAMLIPSDLVVVVSVRRADDWARSMFVKPWHTTAAMQDLEFSDFLRAPWDTVTDRHFKGKVPEFQRAQPLQLDRDPMTGACYKNLFALRQGKLRAHLSYLNRDCHVCLVRIESVLENPEGFVVAFREAFGLPPLTEEFRPVKKQLGAAFLPANVQQDRPRPDRLSREDMAFLREQSDLALEAALGYHY